MSKNSDILPLFGGKTVNEWNDEWSTLKGGFKVPHRQLHGFMGLYCARLSGKIMFVGRSSAEKGGRLYKRLLNFKNQPQSATRHYGAEQIRKHIDDLSLEVICLGKTLEERAFTVPLARAMIQLHQPLWNMRKKAIKK